MQDFDKDFIFDGEDALGLSDTDFENRIVSTSFGAGDEAEFSLRPRRMEEYIGQDKAKENLNVYIEAARMRGDSLDHVLLYGPPGLGKTTLSGIIAAEMGVNLRVTSGPAIEKQGDLAALLTNLNQGDVLFIDEIHRLPRTVEEILYPAMEDFALDIIIGKGPAARSIRIDLPKFTLTGGTTGSITVSQSGKLYNIVQIGDSSNTGLLKSITSEGKWEGTVYLVPFHTKVVSTAIEALNNPVAGTQNQFATGDLSTIKNSDQAEITFNARKIGSARAWVEISVYHKDCLLADSTTTYELTNTMTVYRYVLANQLYESGLEVRITFHTEAGDGSMDSIVLENLYGTLQYEQAAFTYYDGPDAHKQNVAHKGGVTFDLMDRDMLG